MNIKVYFPIIVLAFLMTSCKNENSIDKQNISQNSNFSVLLNDEISNFDKINNLSNLYTNFEVIYLKNSEDLNVNEVLIKNDLIFIEDLKKSSWNLNIFETSGELISKISSSNFKKYPTSQFVDFSYNNEKNTIWIGDNENKTFYESDLNGKIISFKEVPFNFFKFSYSPKAQKFIVYYLISKGPSTFANVGVFNKNLKLEKNLFDEDIYLDTDISFGFASRYQESATNVYFNPHNTGIIYKLNYDGSKEVVLNLNFEKGDFDYQSDDFNKRIPFPTFTVNKDNVYFGMANDYRVMQTYIDRNDLNNKFSLSPGIPLENYGNEFRFVGTTPLNSDATKFYSIINNNKLDVIIENLVDQDHAKALNEDHNGLTVIGFEINNKKVSKELESNL